MPGHALVSFISYRSNENFSKRLMALRPDMWKRLEVFSIPLSDDIDVDFFTTLYEQNLISEERRVRFVETVRSAAVHDADGSFLEHEGISAVLSDEERRTILNEVNLNVLKVLGNPRRLGSQQLG